MVQKTYVPIIIGAFLSPNPAKAGQPVLVSIAAADLEIVPRAEAFTSGEFSSGEE